MINLAHENNIVNMTNDEPSRPYSYNHQIKSATTRTDPTSAHSSPRTIRIQLSFEVENLQKIMSGFLWKRHFTNSPCVVVTNQDRSYEYGSTEV